MKNKKEELEKIERFSNQMKKHVLAMSVAAGGNSSHFGGGLSIVDITATLFGSIMNYDRANPKWEKRDRFILSKGHGCLGYALSRVSARCGRRTSMIHSQGTNIHLDQPLPKGYYYQTHWWNSKSICLADIWHNV